MRWDLYVMLLAVWNCVSIPFEVAFDPEEPPLYVILNNICDISFVIDIILYFRTTFLNQFETEITDQCAIIKHYIKGGQFFIDLCASVPFDDIYILLFVSGNS